MLIIMLISGIALLLASVTLLAYEIITFRHTMVRVLSVQANMIGGLSTAALEFNDPKTANDDILKLQTHEQHGVSACIYKKGKIFARYLRAGVGNDFSLPEPMADGYEFGENSLTVFRRITLNGERIGSLYIQSDLEECSTLLK